jgi:hypothetical protein
MQLSYFLNEMSFFLNAHLRKLFSYLVICKLPFKVDHYCPSILHYLQNYSPIFECSLCFPLPVYFGFFSGLWSITLFPSKLTNLIIFIYFLNFCLFFFFEVLLLHLLSDGRGNTRYHGLVYQYGGQSMLNSLEAHIYAGIA